MRVHDWELALQERENERLRKAYEQRIDKLQRENERLRAEKRTLIDDRKERTELVAYVEDELSYREASLGKRVKWWLFGRTNEIEYFYIY